MRAYVYTLVVLSNVAALNAKVVTLTDANFEELTKATAGTSKHDWFVEFYAPWCGHCKAMESTWSKLGKRLGESDSNVKVGKVDATTEVLTARRFDIRGFPTLVLLTKGRIKRYSGNRNEDKLYEFVTGS